MSTTMNRPISGESRVVTSSLIISDKAKIEMLEKDNKILRKELEIMTIKHEEMTMKYSELLMSIPKRKREEEEERRNVRMREEEEEEEENELEKSGIIKIERPVCYFCFGRHRCTQCFVKYCIYQYRKEEIKILSDLGKKNKIKDFVIEGVIYDYMRRYLRWFPRENHLYYPPSVLIDKINKEGLHVKYVEKYEEMEEIEYLIEKEELLKKMKENNMKAKVTSSCYLCKSIMHTADNCPIYRFIRERNGDILEKKKEELIKDGVTQEARRASLRRMARILYSNYLDEKLE